MKINKNRIRHPTKKKSKNPTYTHTLVSIGKQEKKLLTYINNNREERFNVKAYARLINTPRSTIYDRLDRLQGLGFIKRELANNLITEKGTIALGVSDKGVGKSRRECRKKENLSTHYHKFKLPISDKSEFSISNIKKLNPIDINENKLHNLHQIIVSFEDATILINPKQLIINLYDVISKDVDEADIKCLSRAIEYAKKFISIGVITQGIIVEEGHWARIESILSDFLYEKVDNRYFLDLGKGRKFWIDHSDGKREDETDDKDIRARIDNFLTDVIGSEALISDVDKIVKALGFVTKIECARLKSKISPDFNGIDRKKRPYYIQ